MPAQKNDELSEDLLLYGIQYLCLYVMRKLELNVKFV